MRVFLVFLAFVVAVAAPAQGPGMPLPMSQSFTFGMIGLAANQVARVNVVNPAVTPIAGYTCSAAISIVDGQGTVLKSQSFQVDPQKAVLLDLSRSDISGDSGRVQIRAVVQSSVSGGGPDTRPIITLGSICSPLATLEVFDRDNGRTRIFLSEGRMVPLAVPAAGVNGRAPQARGPDRVR